MCDKIKIGVILNNIKNASYTKSGSDDESKSLGTVSTKNIHKTSNVTLETILASIKNNEPNNQDVYDMYRKKYEKLRDYEYVPYDELFGTIESGNIIIYSKNINHISCACVVVIINKSTRYTENLQNVFVESIVVGTPKYMKEQSGLWKIYPQKYRVFVKTCKSSCNSGIYEVYKKMIKNEHN